LLLSDRSSKAASRNEISPGNLPPGGSGSKTKNKVAVRTNRAHLHWASNAPGLCPWRMLQVDAGRYLTGRNITMPPVPIAQQTLWYTPGTRKESAPSCEGHRAMPQQSGLGTRLPAVMSVGGRQPTHHDLRRILRLYGLTAKRTLI